VNGRVAALLGVGPGLGTAMARREESLAQVRQDIEVDGGTALTVSADATDADSVAVAACLRILGNLDVLAPCLEFNLN
jgi:hypothetical protein